MLAPHPCLARVLVQLAGQNIALLQRVFSYSPGYTLEQVDGRTEKAGHADTRKTMADFRSEN